MTCLTRRSFGRYLENCNSVDWRPQGRVFTTPKNYFLSNRCSISAFGGVDISWIPTATLESNIDQLGQFDGIWCVPGSPYKSLIGALEGIRWARQSRKPFLGTCGGFQHVVLEYARNVLGIHEAQHEEYDPYASKLIVSRLPCSLVGNRLLIELS